MPRPNMFSKPLSRELPRVRVSEDLFNLVQRVGTQYGIGVSDLVRACIAHTLNLKHENSDLIARMLRKAAEQEVVLLRENSGGE